MTLVKSNKRKRLFPLSTNPIFWHSNPFQNLMNYDTLLKDDFFEMDNVLPAMNIVEHEDDFEIEVAVPGFTKKDFEITIENDILHVKGEKRIEKEEDTDLDYYHKEFSYSSFRRSLRLPDNVNTEADLKATYKNGILKLRLLKLEEDKKETERLIEIE